MTATATPRSNHPKVYLARFTYAEICQLARLEAMPGALGRLGERMKAKRDYIEFARGKGVSVSVAEAQQTYSDIEKERQQDLDEEWRFQNRDILAADE